MRRWLLGVGLAWISAIAASAQRPPVPAEPVLAFEEDALTVSGLTPAGSMAWLLVARHFEAQGMRLVRRSGVARDEDGDGQVRVEIDLPVPEQSVAVAVDLASGGASVAAAPGFPLRTHELPPHAIRPGNAGGAHVFSLEERNLIEVSLFRPDGPGRQNGAWHRAVGDGGASDRDGQRNDRIEVVLDSLEPSPGVPGPPTIVRPDDIVVAIDSHSLDVFGPRQVEPQ